MNDEYDALLVEDGSPRKTLRATLRKYQNTPLLDLRYWYEDKKTKEYRPTSKGISLTKSNYLSVRSIAIDHHDDIMEYLDVGSIDAKGTGDQETINKSNTAQYGVVNEVHVNINYLKPSTSVYVISYEGSAAHITLNKSHPFMKSLIDAAAQNTEALAVRKIAELLLAVDLTLTTQIAYEASSPDVISELFGFGLSQYLRKISEAGS